MPPEDYLAHVSEDGRRIVVVDVETTGLSPQRGDRVNVPRVRGMNRCRGFRSCATLHVPRVCGDEPLCRRGRAVPDCSARQRWRTRIET
jgi:hypothetical protein